MKSAKRQSAAHKRDRTFSPRQRRLWVGSAGALALFISIGVAVTWESPPPIPANRLVRVYLQRGCPCAVPWMDKLKASGFFVEPLDAGDMHLLRHKMKVPDHLQGCHLGEYLGYFLDGHIPPQGLHALARWRPTALGIGMASDMVVVNAPSATSANDKDAMIIFERSGVAQLWSIPELPAAATSTTQDEHGGAL